jgi:hypothetical protein
MLEFWSKSWWVSRKETPEPMSTAQRCTLRALTYIFFLSSQLYSLLLLTRRMRNSLDHVEEEDADENDCNECENGHYGNL